MQKLAIILCMMSAILPAQWPNRPTPGMPRTPDGKADLSAPAPRSADGKPDLSGVWRVANANALFHITGDLKPEEIRPWAAAVYKQREDDFRRDTDGIACLPPGPKAGIGVGGTPMKILQMPNLVAILYEYQTIFRQIFTDGRGLPEDPNPAWMGYSVGHWDGDTLVAESNGYNDKTWLDNTGHPHTESLRVTERYRRTDFGHIELQVTFDDPMVFTKPVTVPIHMELIADTEMIEYVCGENEKDRSHMPVVTAAIDVKVPAAILKTYAGSYDVKEDTKTVIAEVFAEENGLFVNYDNQGRQKLDALSETTFSLAGTIFEFLRDGQKGVSMFRIKMAEGEFAGTRRK